MSVGRMAALPMYDFPNVVDAHDALWTEIAKRLRDAGVEGVPASLTRDLDFVASWRHPSLLLGQACEFPLAKFHADDVRVVATPRYTAEGCEGFRYRSLIVVRRGDPVRSLADLRRRRCVVNDFDSNSGMNLLRVTISAVAGGAKFFDSVCESGSHRRSAAMVAGGEADVAALDCVSFAHIQRVDAAVATELRVLARTPSSRCLPFITSRANDEAILVKLRAALIDVCGDPKLAVIRERLFLDGVDTAPTTGFADVLAFERQAVEVGYPVLA